MTVSVDPVQLNVSVIESVPNTVTISETPSLSVTISQAPDPTVQISAIGTQGLQGIQGIQGIPGAKGDKGDTGDTGLKGDKGDTGDMGPQGLPGTNGLGVPAGGTTGQVLRKVSATDNDTEWHSLGSMSEQNASAVAITGGTIVADSINETSDARVKSDVHALKNPLRKIMTLRAVEFHSLVSGHREIGLIAQEVIGVFPEAVQIDKTLSLSYARLVAPLIGAVQEQQRHIRALWAMIVLLLLVLFCSPAHALTAPSIELSGTSVVVSATKPGATISASIGYFRAVSASIANVGLTTSQNVSVTNGVSVTGNVSAAKFIGDGSLLSGVVTNSSPSWYAIQNTPSPVQAVSNSGSITMAEVSATRLYAANISGSSIAGTLTTPAQANITSVGTLTGLTVSGVGTFGTASATAVNGLNISGTNIAGRLTTAAQPSVTSLGSLTGLTVSGQSALTTVSLTSVSATGNISAAKFVGDGSLLANLPAGAVTSVFGRTGAVAATSGDYTSSLVSNSSNVAGSTVTAALNTLFTTAPTWTSITSVPAGVANVSNSTGSVTATTFTATNLGGTLTTTSQNLIQTMTGLTAVSVTGNISVSTINGQLPVFGGGGGSGDVVGPSSATDGAIVRFNGTTGKLVQNSSATIDGSGVFTLPSTAIPSAPASGNLKLFAYTYASKELPAFITSSGYNSLLQPYFARNSIAYWSVIPGSVTPVGFRNTALTSMGNTNSSPVPSTGSLYNYLPKIENSISAPSTTAVAGFYADTRWTVGGASAGIGGFSYVSRFAPAGGVSITTTRSFVGLNSNASAIADVNPSTLTQLVGVGWDSSDTNIQLIRNDGSGTASKIDLGSSFPRPTVDKAKVYELAMYSPPGPTQSVNYMFTDLVSNTSVTGTVSTDLPPTSIMLSPKMYMSAGGTSSQPKLGFMSLYIETEY